MHILCMQQRTAAATFGTPDSVPAMALTRALTKTLVFEKNIHTWLEAEESKVLEVSSLPAQERRVRSPVFGTNTSVGA